MVPISPLLNHVNIKTSGLLADLGHSHPPNANIAYFSDFGYPLRANPRMASTGDACSGPIYLPSISQCSRWFARPIRAETPHRTEGLVAKPDGDSMVYPETPQATSKDAAQLTLVAKLRRGHFLKYINLSGRGLEIGPYGQPTVLKSEADIAYLDWETREELAAKCQDPEERRRIPETDYVVTSNKYSSFAPGTFSYIIANHVLEHVPNLIEWLSELAGMLSPDGILCLALPDRKYTFDKFRPATTLSHILSDFYEHTERISSDHFLEAEVYYDLGFLGQPMIVSNRLDRARLESMLEQGAHIGYHCHVFQSETVLETIFRPLFWMRYADFEILDFVPATLECGGEMLLVLKKIHQAADRGSIDSVSFYRSDAGVDSDVQKALLGSLREQTTRLQAQLEAMTNSRSWKITRPLRDAGQWLRSLRSRRPA